MDAHTISGSRISARIKSDGAELCFLRDQDGRDYLWPAGPAWPRHAPHLFPIVGRLNHDKFRHKGREYGMTQHGFARDRRFAWEKTDISSCALSLRDDSQTRMIYPFSFTFDIAYAIDGDTLSIAYTIANTGDDVMPAAIGAHPAFRWPLREEFRKEDYRLHFSKPEPQPTLRLANGLLMTETFSSPVQGCDLPLNEDLFENDAIIFDQVRSGSVLYAAPDGSGIEIDWDTDFSTLGLWSRKGADFLCIEPWHGISSPMDFDGELSDKPGMLLIAPGASRRLGYRIRLCC
ncbi:MAG TPA: aldose 1-epimerase family protein [Micavibrio sp.]|jgi:galactose mutarotase-like enzyme